MRNCKGTHEQSLLTVCSPQHQVLPKWWNIKLRYTNELLLFKMGRPLRENALILELLNVRGLQYAASTAQIMTLQWSQGRLMAEQREGGVIHLEAPGAGVADHAKRNEEDGSVDIHAYARNIVSCMCMMSLLMSRKSLSEASSAIRHN